MTEPAGTWIFDPNAASSRARADNDPSISNYEAYWNVSPRSTFLALTNYIGVQKISLAMDRFTGTQIWNRPIVGYRLLPISSTAAAPVVRGTKTIYPVTLGVKIYWANDDLPYDFKRTEGLNWNVADAKFSSDTVPNPPGAS